MTDVERLLTDAGAAWREGQLPPPEPDAERIAAARSRRWWPVWVPAGGRARPVAVPALAAAGTVAVVVAIVLGALVFRPARPPVVQGPPVAPATSAPPVSVSAPTAAELLVHDGDLVAANGVVQADPGQPVRFCPDVPRTTDKRSCGQTGVTVTVVALDRLAERQVSGGTVVGLAWLRGVYRGGVVEVREQALPRPEPPARGIFFTPPCAPPPGPPGRSVDEEALMRYVDARPDRLNGVALSHPGGGPVMHIVGVSRGDPAAAQRELRKRFGQRICAVRVRFTKAEQQRVRAATERLLRDGPDVIYGTGCGCAFRPVFVMLTVLDQRRYDLLKPIGFDQLELRVWLRPSR